MVVLHTDNFPPRIEQKLIKINQTESQTEIKRKSNFRRQGLSANLRHTHKFRTGVWHAHTHTCSRAVLPPPAHIRMHNSQDVDAQLDLARAPRGGRRRGAGRPFGVKNKSTLLSEEHSRSLEVLAALQDEGLVCDITVRIYHEEDSRLEGSVFTKRVDKEQLSGVIDSFKKYKREEFERLVATLVKQRRERQQLVGERERSARLNKEQEDKAELFLQVSSAFGSHCPA